MVVQNLKKKKLSLGGNPKVISYSCADSQIKTC